MYWSDGSKYEGDWFKGIQHGYGKITFSDGSFKEGVFENNMFRSPDNAENDASYFEDDYQQSSIIENEAT
jgi:hypothetical protein